MLWLQFFICVLLIIISGSRITVYADTISKKTNFSAGLMGILVLAFITSCPELVTSLSSIKVVDAPDLAAGDLVGACMFNILTIAILGALSGKGSLLEKQCKGNITTIILTVLMLLITMGSIILWHFNGLALGVWNIGIGSILIGATYIIGIGFISRHEVNSVEPGVKEKVAPSLIIKMIMAAAVIIFSGVWLAHIGKAITISYHLSEVYVGVLLLAFATTMPEFVVSFTALRRNSIHMATGNLLGSNLFNLFIIFILDASLRKGEFFSYISKSNILPTFFAIILTLITLAAMLKKGKRKKVFRYFSWDSAMVIGVFLTAHLLIFNLVRILK